MTKEIEWIVGGVNAKLQSLGYTSLDDARLEIILGMTGSDFFEWAGSFCVLGETSRCWPALKASLLCSHPDFFSRLMALGDDVDHTAAFNSMKDSSAASKDAAKVLRNQMGISTWVKMYVKPAGVSKKEIASKTAHVYGSSSSVTFELTRSKTDEACIQVDAAGKVGSKFDWKNKISIQLSTDEMLMIVAVLNGWMPICEISNHGVNRDKYMTLRKEDGDGWFVSVRQGRVARSCQIKRFEAFNIIQLVVTALSGPGMDFGAVVLLAKRLATLGQNETVSDL